MFSSHKLSQQSCFLAVNFDQKQFLATLFLLAVAAPLQLAAQDAKREREKVPQIRFSETAPLAAKFRKNRLDFYLKQIDLFDQHSQDSPELKKRGKKYLRAAISYCTNQRAYEDPEYQYFNTLLTQGVGLLDDGCEDPLVLMYHASVLVTRYTHDGRNVGPTPENPSLEFPPNEHPVEIASQALKAFEDSDYPAGLEILFLTALNKARGKYSVRGDRSELDLRVYRSLPAWIRMAKGNPDWQRIVYRSIQRYPVLFGRLGSTQRYNALHIFPRDQQKAQYLAEIQKLKDTKAVENPWLIEMLFADHHDSHSSSRDLHSVYSPPKELRDELKTERRQAARHYEKAHAMAPDRPEAAARLIFLAYEKVATGSRWDWFQKAIDAELDNADAYSYLVWTCGLVHPEDLVKLGRQFVETERYDSDVPLKFAACVFRMHRDIFQWMLRQDSSITDTFYVIITEYADKHGDGLGEGKLTWGQIGLLRKLFYYLYQTRQYSEAVNIKRMLDQSGRSWFWYRKDKVYLGSAAHAWKKHEEKLNEMRIEFGLFGAELVGGNAEEIHDHLQALIGKGDEEAEPYLKLGTTLAGQLRDYDKGDWVELKCGFPADHLWGLTGNCLFEDDRSMIGSSFHDSDWFNLKHAGNFAVPMEVQFNVNLLHSKGKPYVGIKRTKHGGADFQLNPKDGLAGVGYGPRRWIPVPGVKSGQDIHVTVQIWDRENFQFFVNGFFIDSGVVKLGNEVSGVVTLRGQGKGNKKEKGRIVARFSNVRIRKIPFGPAPAPTEFQKGLVYFTDAIERDPELAWNFLRRGNCHLGLGHSKEAMQDLKRGLELDPRISEDVVALGRICFELGHYPDAKMYLEKAAAGYQDALPKLPKSDLFDKDGKKRKGVPWTITRAHQLESYRVAGVDCENADQLKERLTNCRRELAILYATCPDDSIRDGVRAMKLVGQLAPHLKENSTDYLIAKAYAQAELGQFKAAIDSLNKARSATDDEGILKQLERTTELFEEKKPFRHQPALSDQPQEYREFTGANGKEIVAKVLKVEDDMATIKSKQGNEFTLPLSKFSAHDQAFLKAWKPSSGPEAFTAKVTIEPTVQKFIGGVSTLDRTKYFNLHASGNDPQLQEFYAEFNVVRLGRSFAGPGAAAKSKTGKVGVYPELKSKSAEPKPVTRFVGTEHPRNVYKEGVDIEGFSNWAVEFYKNLDAAARPLWYEPMNEPFVHARDFYDEKDWDTVAEARVKTEMAQLYKAVGEKIHAEPALSNMRVIGNTSAWPSFELNDFSNWERNMKMFMDIAGEQMDAISYHLYDGTNQAGQSTRRAGASNDAVMDLIETYSHAKWGEIKPHAITEYGAIADKKFTMLKNVQAVRSQNAMIFGLFDREDRLEISIPLTVDKATWHITKANDFLPYNAVLWKAANVGVPKDQVTGWVYTDRIHFYALWKDVQGSRVHVRTDNPDVQAQGFLDGKKLYLALNNLDDNPQKVKIELPDTRFEPEQVRIKSLTVFKQKPPTYEDKILSEAPTVLPLDFGQTVVLEYTLEKGVKFEKSMYTKRYYTTKHLQAIEARKEMLFEFKNVEPGEGFASLSMSVGRMHHKSKAPVVKVNRTRVEVPANWKGDDQASRKKFFGNIEIPVPVELIKESNTVSIKFPDTGGHVSTLILNLETISN